MDSHALLFWPMQFPSLICARGLRVLTLQGLAYVPAHKLTTEVRRGRPKKEKKKDRLEVARHSTVISSYLHCNENMWFMAPSGQAALEMNIILRRKENTVAKFRNPLNLIPKSHVCSLSLPWETVSWTRSAASNRMLRKIFQDMQHNQFGTISRS